MTLRPNNKYLKSVSSEAAPGLLKLCNLYKVKNKTEEEKIETCK